MYMPAKPAPTTTTSYASVAAGWPLADMDGNADIRAPLEIFLLLRTSILPAAPKRKGQIRHSGLHILPDGMPDCCTAIPGVSTQDQARGNLLGFATPDALASPDLRRPDQK